MPPIFPNAPFNPTSEYTPGEVAAQQARLLLAEITPDKIASITTATAQTVHTTPPPTDPAQKKLHDTLNKKLTESPDFFLQRTPTVAQLAEFLLLTELPFFHLKQPRQRAEIKGGFDTAAMYLLLARPNLLAYGINSAVIELRIAFTRPGPKRRQFEELARQQMQAIRTAPAHTPDNAGWNDFFLGRYLMLGRAEDLDQIVRRYAGTSPANVEKRGMITHTARWMVNSYMQQHSWFARAFETAWYLSGDARELPILPAVEDVASMFMDPEPSTGAPN